jgi:hypothetical protein
MPHAPKSPPAAPNNNALDEALIFDQGDTKSTGKAPTSTSTDDGSSTKKKSSSSSRKVSNVCCCHCGGLRHTSLVCLDLKALKKPPEQVHAMVESNATLVTRNESSIIILAQVESESHTHIDPDFLLLDSQFTVD